jgi:hypothetical protein
MKTHVKHPKILFLSTTHTINIHKHASTFISYSHTYTHTTARQTNAHSTKMRVINVLAAAFLMLSSSSSAASCNVAFRKAPAAGHSTKKVIAGKTFVFSQSIKNTGSTQLKDLYFQVELPAYLVPVKATAPKFVKGSDTLLQGRKVLLRDMQLAARKTLKVRITIGVKGCQSAGNVQIQGSAYQLDSTDQVICSSDMTPYTISVVRKNSASSKKWGASQKHATWDDDDCTPPTPAPTRAPPVVLQFNASTTWTVPAGVTSVEVCVVAGGGGGGYSVAGGGGAGGFIYDSNLAVTPGQGVTVTIGAGGAGGTNGVSNIGQNTVFASLTAIGGAAGQNFNQKSPGTPGGSGGGGAPQNTPAIGPPGGSTPGQGNNGGTAYYAALSVGGGGGGGADTVGGNAAIASLSGGAGGAGKVCAINGVTYAGGGGGYGLNIAGAGGSGGGGAGQSTDTFPGAAGNPGLANTGGGGGAGGYIASGGSGGSGVVIIKYQSV